LALIACSECGKQISKLAASCPSCGYPMQSSATMASPVKDSLMNPGVLGKATTVLGAWLVVPWLARLLAFITACVVAIVVVISSR
jgi:predicted amidophosphoribosyltransferase